MTQQRNIAYHEAGHTVVGRHFGLVTAYAYIHQVSFTRDNGSTFKIWNGLTRAPWSSLSDHKQRVASVAGAVAVNCWSDREQEDGIPPDYFAVADLMSDGDWTINGVQADPSTMSDADERRWWKAMQEAHALLNCKTGLLWRELRREANQLIAAANGGDPRRLRKLTIEPKR